MERSVTATFFFLQNVDRSFELRVRFNLTGLTKNHTTFDFVLVDTTEQQTYVVTSFTLIQQLAEHFNTSSFFADMPNFAASISVIFLCNRLLQFFLRCAILYSQRGTRDSGQARYAAFSPRWSFWTGRLPSFSCSSLEPTTAGPYLNFDPYSFPFFSAALRARFLAKGRWAFFCPNFAPDHSHTVPLPSSAKSRPARSSAQAVR